MSWTQPSCIGCWYARHPDLEPHRLTAPCGEACCFCGRGTTSGIYVRVDPSTVPYPKITDQEREVMTTQPEEPMIADEAYPLGKTSPGTITASQTDELTHALKFLQARIVANNIEKGWRINDGRRRNFGELCMLIDSETAEAFECFRNGEPLLHYADNGKPEGMASELADIIIRVLDVADEYDAPVIQALFEKHAFNLTRAYRHGGKAC